MGFQDVSVVNGTGHQGRSLKLESWNPHGKRQTPTIIIWPPHAITHMSTHEDMPAHTHVHTINKCDQNYR